MRRTVRALMCLACWCALAATSYAQDIEPKYKTADTNNAVIQGRVVLPSGFAAKRYVRITLKTAQNVLSTLYTNNSGEFQIMNLSEGVYYVQAEVQDDSFEPAVTMVELGRGLVARLTLVLREKMSPDGVRLGARVVSAAELHQSVPAAAKKEYDQGLKFVKKGDFLQAAEHFEEAVSIYPEYLSARNDLGAQYLKLKRLDEAEKNFRIVVGQDPKNFNAKFNLGLVRIERRDYPDAISQLNQAIAIDSSRPAARLWLGFALLEMGDLAGAERELTASLLMGESECVAAHYHLARLYLARGDAVGAARAVRAYLDESPRGEYVKEARQLEARLQGQGKTQARK
jgi:tetratricopeptide (TPR) repeat protein